jgi:hypothetical protein
MQAICYLTVAVKACRGINQARVPGLLHARSLLWGCSLCARRNISTEHRHGIWRDGKRPGGSKLLVRWRHRTRTHAAARALLRHANRSCGEDEPSTVDPVLDDHDRV